MWPRNKQAALPIIKQPTWPTTLTLLTTLSIACHHYRTMLHRAAQCWARICDNLSGNFYLSMIVAVITVLVRAASLPNCPAPTAADQIRDGRPRIHLPPTGAKALVGAQLRVDWKCRLNIGRLQWPTCRGRRTSTKDDFD